MRAWFLVKRTATSLIADFVNRHQKCWFGLPSPQMKLDKCGSKEPVDGFGHGRTLADVAGN